MRAAIFAVFAVVVVATVVTEASHWKTCQPRGIWPYPFRKDNRISRTVFENVVAKGSWHNVYIIDIGVPMLGTFMKGEHDYRVQPDGTVTQRLNSFVVESNQCVERGLMHTVSEIKACQFGVEKYVQLSPDGGESTLTFHSQDPSKYILMNACFVVGADGTCNNGLVAVQIRDYRIPLGVVGSEVSLNYVPWHKIAYDVLSVTGLEFGEPGIRQALGRDCQLPIILEPLPPSLPPSFN